MFEFFTDTEDFDLALPQKALPAIEAIVKDYTLNVEYIHFIFVDDEQLLEINWQYLQHDYYTDIITFNYAEGDAPIQGELYISIDRVEENAKELGIKTDDELFRVMVHGVLHLTGLNDTTIDERKQMQAIEDKYISLVSSTWNIQQEIKNV